MSWYKCMMAGAVLAACWGCGAPGSKPEAVQGGAAMLPRETAYLRVQHTPSGDTLYADTTMLRLVSQDGVHVYGSYRWRPPGKDGRMGAITAVRDKDTIAGMFSYRQEGGQYRDSVRIIIVKSQAVVMQYSSEGYILRDTLTAESP